MTKKTMVYCYKIDSTFDKQCMIHCDPFCCPPNIDQGCDGLGQNLGDISDDLFCNKRQFFAPYCHNREISFL